VLFFKNMVSICSHGTVTSHRDSSSFRCSHLTCTRYQKQK